ncbi:MAG TPA: hemolysin family protein [Phycisphaerae bacterium]|nr:hemolysin family protein [Phycisphaerae bacterium]
MNAFFIQNLGFLIPMLVLLMVSAAFSCCETTLFSLTRHDLYQFRNSGQRQKLAAAALRERGRILLIIILVLNMASNVLIFILSTFVLVRVAEQYGDFIAAVLSIVPILLVAYFGDVVPKMIGRRFNRRLAPLLAAPLTVLTDLLEPMARVIHLVLMEPVHRLLGHDAPPAGLELDELRELLLMSQSQGAIDLTENQLLQQVLWLKEIRVRHIMVPRVDMLAFDINRPASELVELFRTSHRSKVPVYDRQIDNILGLLYAKEYLLQLPADITGIRALLKPVQFVPELQTLDRLLSYFREKRVQTSLVVDEYGGIAGLVTLEDVVEALIGEIHTPGDPARRTVEQTGEDEWLVPGDLSLIECGELFGQHLFTTKITTIGGLIYANLNRIPKVGDQIRLHNLELTVESMHGRRVADVRLRISKQVHAAKEGGS